MHSKMLRLAIVAAVALVIAIWVGNSRTPKNEVAGVEPAVPGLDAGLNEVTRIRVVGAGDAAIATLERGEGGWTVVEKGYAADVAKVRELLLKLSNAKLLEPKTSVPESYAKLGVEDVSGADAKSVLLEIEGLAEPAKLLVGNYNARSGEATFVRRAGEPQSWLASGNLTVDKEAANWLDRDLLDISSSRIAEVRITSGGRTLRVFKTDSTAPNYQVADIPKGRELSSEFVANGLASVLAGLRFDDVLKADAVEPGDAKVFAIEYRTFEGVVIDARAWERGGKHYATFDARLDEAAADAWIASMQAKAAADHAARATAPPPTATATEPGDPDAAAAVDVPAAGSAEQAASTDAGAPPALPAGDPVEAPLAVTDPAKDREQQIARLEQEIAALDAKFAGWVFVLPNYKFANMNKTLDDLLKPKDAK